MMKKSRTTALFTIAWSLCLILLAILPAAAAVYTVPGDFPSLEAAEGVAGAGDTVVLLGAGRHPTPDRRRPRPFRVIATREDALSVTAPPQPQNACTGGTVTGKVTDENGTGVANVSVWFHDESSGSYTQALTVAAGDYTVCLPAGNYGIFFYEKFHLQSVYNGKEWGCGETLTVKPGETIPDVNGVVPVAGSIAGKVTADGVTPVLGIRVHAYGIDVPFVISAPTIFNGEYVIHGLPTGNYRVRFRDLGPIESNSFEFYDDHAMEGDSDPVAVTAGQATTGIDAVVPLGGTISGTVDDGSTGIAGMLVEAFLPDGMFARSATTDGTGAYTIQGLRSGSYRLLFEGQPVGFQDRWRDGSVAVTAPGDTGGIDATLVPGGSISGTVTSVGAGLPEINLYLFDSQGEYMAFARTDASGDYTVQGVPSGEYRLLFWGDHKGYVNVWHGSRNTLAGAQKVSVTAPADTPGVDVQMSLYTAGTLSGRINFTGNACGPVSVRPQPPDVIDDSWWVSRNRVGPSGAWHSKPLSPGPWRLLAHADDLDPVRSRWYGGTPSPGFSKIARVTAGQDTAGINFKIPSREPLPEPGIVLGDYDHVTFMGPGEKQPLLLDMDCGDAKGLPVDWWLLAYTPLPPPKDIYHFEPGRGWVEGMAVSKQAPCVNLDGYGVTDLPFFPFDDDIDIFFGIDSSMNGALDLPSLFYDGVRAHMYR